jgi:hypothetical protein
VEIMSDAPAHPCERIDCPVCRERMKLTSDHRSVKICICTNCGTSVSVPESAWKKADGKP